jgi:hypothetical protein
MPDQAAPPFDAAVTETTYQPGENAEMDAWVTAFFIENHLDHLTHPEHAATPEQVQFMVHTENGERYYPCSDRMFRAIIGRQNSARLQRKYNEVLDRILALVDNQIEDDYDKRFLESLIIVKFKHETRDEIMLPSRLEKRLISIFLNRTRIEDPFLFEKTTVNRRMQAVLASGPFQKALDHVRPETIEAGPNTLSDLVRQVVRIKLNRLFALIGERRLWQTDPEGDRRLESFLEIFDRPLCGDGAGRLIDFLCSSCEGPEGHETRPKKILWLIDESGEAVADLHLVRYLTELGHKVVVAFKEGPLFTKADFVAAQEDPVLVSALAGALILEEKKMGKNDLVRILRSDADIIAIPDGTKENVNLLLVSTTFARVFKEVDAVISRGPDQWRRFFNTHFHFTQDIYNISSEETGTTRIDFKPRHESVIKFSHSDLENKAKTIIEGMARAKSRGMTVIFYSGIIGSIPGRIEMAKKIMSIFIKHLLEQSAQTFIINPSEHYEPGMDADDLMYFWEIVQRSGKIDIWRFQSYEDIARAFEIMDQKVPPEWVGKDATFSTGCTQEMHIATDVQERFPEMQIIGPSRERFMRRSRYGVGKMFDERL